MLELVSDNTTNVVPFPRGKSERPTIGLVAMLAPSQSFVATLMIERGDWQNDTNVEAAREIAYQARMLQAAYGRDETVIRLRGLVDAHVAHAIELCRAYREAGDSLMHLEYEAAQAIRLEARGQMELAGARDRVRGSAIAARVAADAAFGAVTAFSTYVLDGLAGLPASKTDPRQLVLLAAAG